MKKSNYYITKQDFRIWVNNEYMRIYRDEVSGYTFTVKDHAFGITKGYNEWYITHLNTGLGVGSCKRKKDAIPYVERTYNDLIKLIELNTPGKAVEGANIVNNGWDIYKVRNYLCFDYKLIGIDGVWNDDTEEFAFAKSLFDKNTIIRTEVA